MSMCDEGVSIKTKTPWWSRKALHVAGLLLLVALIYGHTLDAPFEFDDRHAILSSNLIKNLDYFRYPSAARTLYDYGLNRYQTRYIGLLTLALNYHFHNIELAGYHVVNISIHALGALGVYALCLSLFATPVLARSALWARRREVALLASALFAAHPIQTQAVTYIVQRLTSLATLFYIYSALFYLRARLAQSRRATLIFLSLSLLSITLGMKTKEITFTLPFAVLLLEFACFREGLRKRAAFLAPYALTLLIIPLSLISIGKPIGLVLAEAQEESRLESAMPRNEYMATEARVMMTYLRLLVLPIKQNLDYDYPLYPSFYINEVAVSVAVLVFILMAAGGLVRLGREGEPGYMLCGLGIAWYFLALSIESSVIPIIDVIFEHRLYLPMVGMSIAAATAVALIAHTLTSRRALIVLVALCVIAIAALGAATYKRNSLWRDPIVLWHDVAAKSPAKGRVLSNLGYAYDQSSQDARADEYYRKASRIEWRDAFVYFNVGLMAVERNDFLWARRGFTTALRLNPDFRDAQKFLDYLNREGKHIQPGPAALHSGFAKSQDTRLPQGF